MIIRMTTSNTHFPIISVSRIAVKAFFLLLVGSAWAESKKEFGENGNDNDNNKTINRVFPAAKIESYNPNNLTSVLGFLSRCNDISFVVTSISPESDTITKDATATTTSDTLARATNETRTTASPARHSSSSIKSSRRLHNVTPETNVDDVLKPAMTRFKESLGRYPDFRDDYPSNPEGLPLVPISNTFVFALESTDVSLYHGVSEYHEISASVEQTRICGTTDLRTSDGAFEDHVSRDARNNSNGVRITSGDHRTNLNDDDSCVAIRIKASNVFGILRALETLGQLLEFGWMDTKRNENNNNGNADGGDSFGVFVMRDLPLRIVDEPAFPYRGLMIDTSRHYLPMDLILDNLDAMAMNKMNVLHWHISDSQSFPYAPENLPELARKGAYHPKRIYTPQDIRTLTKEAYLRGIRVIPEIDMPGHTNAIAKSHPEVMSHCPHPSEPMNPTVNQTYEFVYEIYKDLHATFPDEMVHLGGDEVHLSEACWLKDPSITKWMIDHGMSNKTVELYKYFETRFFKTIAGFQKTPIVWQEVFDLNLTIPQNTIIDVWKGFDRYSIQNATNKGHRVILSGCWYLDHLDQTWQKFYKCDPLNFTSPHKDLMIGGHASMWAEHVDASNFVSRVWPRASSAAERLWHGTGATATAAAANIAERIHRFRCRMVLMGFDAGPTGPGVCPTEVAYSRRDKGGF
jgi:hexosaminidase